MMAVTFCAISSDAPPLIRIPSLAPTPVPTWKEQLGIRSSESTCNTEARHWSEDERENQREDKIEDEIEDESEDEREDDSKDESKEERQDESEGGDESENEKENESGCGMKKSSRMRRFIHVSLRGSGNESVFM